ncbi:tyrosine-type recombinase/integrase [Pukyongiella litopenaei]|uniref:Site-specific integrase n=1 Tax=Pukyongiella litopenaei TaxID=2605946 RepID=A0A2S0ML58_9RHOB|nr:site-specific integrase [Pukyongiella litopenaei]AVO36625.1 site-specific integrase [Pukyongiella litopenaei]
MRLKYPGLIRDVMPSGNVRYLVRVKGNASKRLTLSCTPDDPDFHEAYHAARQGVSFTRPPTPLEAARRGTVSWLAWSYIAHLESLVEGGEASPLTVKQRKSFAAELVAHKSSAVNSHGRSYAELPMNIPQPELARFLDTFAATPGKARNMLKFLRAMYLWAKGRGHVTINPAAGLSVAYRNMGGATPWTLADLEKYRNTHARGTQAHLTLTLFMFTACRIGDAFQLGRGHEIRHEGAPWLSWQPAKRGSRPVEIPILPPLLAAIRSQSVIGPTYLLTAHGQPYRSAEGLRNRFKKWCIAAGLPDRSSHGIRKSAGHLLSLHGATQYEIMAIHGHANASTSEIYTRGVERQRLAASAASKLANLDW